MDKYDRIRAQLHTLGDGAIELRPSKIKDAGLGLFACREFVQGEPITAYYGQLIDHKTALERRMNKQDSHIRSHFPLRWHIDGRFTANGYPINDPPKELLNHGAAQMANHAVERKNCEYCHVDSKQNRRELRRYCSANGPRIAEIDPNERITLIRATKTIQKGEEILADYGTTYWT